MGTHQVYGVLGEKREAARIFEGTMANLSPHPNFDAIPTRFVLWFHYLHILVNTCFYPYFYSNHPSECEMVSRAALICISLLTDCVENILVCLLAIYTSGEMSSPSPNF